MPCRTQRREQVETPKTLQNGTACLPVTALHAVHLHKGSIGNSDADLLLAGVGSSVTIYDAAAPAAAPFRRVLSCTQIFDGQAVHGITSFEVHENENGIVTIVVLIWGGSRCCLARLGLDGGTENLHRLFPLKTVDVGDWVYDATANGTGSGFLVLTAHNVLLQVLSPLSKDTQVESKEREGDPEIERLAAGLQTLLYSGHIVVAGPRHVIVAAGTIFGDVVVWCCSKATSAGNWIAQTRHVFAGHRGSVFGVCLSTSFLFMGQQRRLLASCSDDRTVRIWEVSDCGDDDLFNKREGSDGNDNKQNRVRGTGFGEEHHETECLANEWGHLSRIWGVDFIAPQAEGEESMQLITRGEDGVCQFWNLDLRKLFSPGQTQDRALQQTWNYRCHAGKNVWSLTFVYIESKLVVFSGGADGQVMRRTIGSIASNKSSILRQRTNMRLSDIVYQINKTRIMRSDPAEIEAGAFRQYVFRTPHHILASTDRGHLVEGSPAGNDGVYTWRLVLSNVTETRSPLTISSNMNGHLIVNSLQNSEIFIYNTALQRRCGPLIVLPEQASWIRLLHVDHNTHLVTFVANLFGNHPSHLVRCGLNLDNDQHCGFEPSISRWPICLPHGFIIASSFYLQEKNLLVCGARNGNIAILNVDVNDGEEVHPCLYTKQVHGHDSVTCIIALPKSASTADEGLIYFLTTGRDGTYAVHAMGTEDEGQVRLETVHRSMPPLGPNIEGAHFQGADLILHGFRSKDFVLWNESAQKQLMAVDCGGAHRSWAFSPAVFENDHVDSFVWTKSGAVNIYCHPQQDRLVIAPGGHGREIKALAVSELFDLVATGAEDTDIRLFRRDTASNAFVCASVLRYHTTGLQHLAFHGRFLFSSAGAEEFFAWKLTTVPILGIGVSLVAKLNKEEQDSDARIMSFDVMNRDCGEDKDRSVCYEILMAYSNGKQKLFEFSTETYAIKLISEVNEGAVCLTQAVLLPNPARRESMKVLAATDGNLRFFEAASAESKTWNRVTGVHQSNVAGLDHVVIGKCLLVATGGDDNSLALTLIHSSQDREQVNQLFVQGPEKLRVPNAHAAALTALCFISEEYGDSRNFLETPSGVRHQHHQDLLLATAGNDQRIKFWRVYYPEPNCDECVDIVEGQKPRLRLEKLAETCTDVADISNIAVLPPRSRIHTCDVTCPSRDEVDVLVAGVGMQVISYRTSDVASTTK